MNQLEFWPEYGSGPLWAGGDRVDLTELGLPSELAGRLVAWNALYEDERRPMEGPGDPDFGGVGGLFGIVARDWSCERPGPLQRWVSLAALVVAS